MESLLWDFRMMETRLWMVWKRVLKMGRRVGRQAAIFVAFTLRLGRCEWFN